MRTLHTVFALAFVAMMGLSAPSQAVEMLPMPPMGEDGLHKEDWFKETFLDIRDDIEEAAAEGKGLVLMWEQEGCPFCAMTHEVNLRDPRIVKYIQDNFFVVQMNLKGSREVTDVDGEAMPENEFAAKMGMRLTPVLTFYPLDPADVDGKSGRDAMAFRVPGYWSPEHFLNMFVYVKSGAYKDHPNFLNWYRAGEGLMTLD